MNAIHQSSPARANAIHGIHTFAPGERVKWLADRHDLPWTFLRYFRSAFDENNRFIWLAMIAGPYGARTSVAAWELVPEMEDA